MKNAIRIGAVFTVMTGLLFLIGCGPTRKEYAINEALLVDQTRMLEDQLYRSYFEVQRLRDENAHLRERLGEPCENAAGKEPVPFQQTRAESKKKEREPAPNLPFQVPNQNPSVTPPGETSELPQLPETGALDFDLPVSQNAYAGAPRRVAQRTAPRNQRMPAKQNYRVGGSLR